MELPQEIIDEGKLIIFIDTPLEYEKAAKEYNKQASECRKTMKLVHQIEDVLLILNPLAVIAIYATSLKVFFSNPALAAALLTLCAGVYIILGLKKRYIWAIPLANVPLLLLNWLPIAVLLVADIGLLLWYNKVIEPLKTKLGYPDFFEVRISYEKRRKPQTFDERK